MDIPINVDVHCTDGRFGQTTCVIIDPISQDVTHVVVQSRHIPNPQYLVPLEFIAGATPEAIELTCSQAKVLTFDEFVEHEFIRVDAPVDHYLPGGFALWPYVLPLDENFVELVHERIPNGETALHRGAKVATVDGPIGQVDELLVEPEDGHITHLVLRHGHLWGTKDVVIPVSAIRKIKADTVFLKLNKEAIEEMPTIPIKRWW
ncbi:MAG: PRC-barrel domain-containing protein [Chloroflexota bacterium]|jgi:sporulation protein YlmC with PRC-barrel domain